MNTSSRVVISLVTLLLSATPLYAAETPAGKPQVQMISGGVGESEMDSMSAAQKDYPLKLIFTQPNGEYLANVSVTIRDKDKNIVVDTSSQGPVVLIGLKPGTYTLVSTAAGDSKTQRIVVRTRGLSTYHIHLRSA